MLQEFRDNLGMLQSRETVLPGQPAGGSGEEANTESILHAIHQAGNPPLWGWADRAHCHASAFNGVDIFSVTIPGGNEPAGRLWAQVDCSWQNCRAITLALDAEVVVGRGTVGEAHIGNKAT